MVGHILWIGASGLRAASLWADAVAHNLANVNTPGFRRRRLELREEEASFLGRVARVAAGVTRGVAAASTLLDGRPGVLEPTGDPLHLAIEGEGWFRVRAADGRTYLTRDGGFTLDGMRRLVTPTGALLLDEAGRPVALPEWAESLQVHPDGRVEAFAAGRSEIVARIALAQVPNPSGLADVGDGLYAETPASGPARAAFPGTEGAGLLRSGVRERANVDLAAELTDLILAQRMFQLSPRVIQTGDELWALVNRLR